MNEGLVIYDFYDLLFTLANSEDPYETVSYLGLRCLYMFPFLIHLKPVPSVSTLNFRLATLLFILVNLWSLLTIFLGHISMMVIYSGQTFLSGSLVFSTSII